MAVATALLADLTGADVCDRCGAEAFVTVLMAGGGELLFCAHHGREHGKALKKIAVDIKGDVSPLKDGPPADSKPGCSA